MTLSLSNLRRMVFGLTFAGCMGFGATQAFADYTWVGIAQACDPYDINSTQMCGEACYELGYSGRARCAIGRGYCECRVP